MFFSVNLNLCGEKSTWAFLAYKASEKSICCSGGYLEPGYLPDRAGPDGATLPRDDTHAGPTQDTEVWPTQVSPLTYSQVIPIPYSLQGKVAFNNLICVPLDQPSS